MLDDVKDWLDKKGKTYALENHNGVQSLTFGLHGVVYTLVRDNLVVERCDPKYRKKVITGVDDVVIAYHHAYFFNHGGILLETIC